MIMNIDDPCLGIRVWLQSYNRNDTLLKSTMLLSNKCHSRSWRSIEGGRVPITRSRITKRTSILKFIESFVI
jgi:hypothetical protein